MDNILTAEQIANYREAGYLVVPDLFTPDEIAAFLQHHDSTPGAGQHGLQNHKYDAAYHTLATHPRVVAAIRQILDSASPRIVQTMFLDKAAGGGRGIALHQDLHYLPFDVTTPNTLMACWVALTDTGPDNGGLCMVPGSHLTGLRTVHKNEDDDHVSWEVQHDMRGKDGREWKQTMQSFQIDDVTDDAIQHLTVPAGAGVFFTGQTIHGSFGNHSPDKPRRAFATHYVHEDTFLTRCDVQNTLGVFEAVTAPAN